MNVLLPPVDVAYAIFVIFMHVFMTKYDSHLNKFTISLKSPDHVDLQEISRTFILCFIFMTTRTQKSNMFIVKNT